MSIFSRIKDAIFGHKSATPPPATTQTTTAEGNVGGAGSAPTTALEEPRTVDVAEVLANIAAAKGNPDLNYQSSIVDLLKLLDIDSSLDNREELATELGQRKRKWFKPEEAAERVDSEELRALIMRSAERAQAKGESA